MPNSIRIKTTPNGGDKYLKLKLDQEFDFIEILSLKVTQEEAYQNFCSDYGVVVGRVIVNSGFGVPNAKVSVFIPIDDIDKNNSVIKNLYPYEVVTDTNNEGIRYNVLPKEPSIDNECFTSVGTLPNKREILDNEVVQEVYCKYYKFTSTTNNAGDFMIFGVPVGTHILHVDVDLSDAGAISQRPYDFIRQGYSPKQFETSTKFKKNTNLDKLPQIKSTNIGINVQPFWGDMDNCEIGITRADVDLNFIVTPTAIFMGSLYGDNEKNNLTQLCRPLINIGKVCEQTVGAGTIEMIRKNIDGQIEEFSVEGGKVIDEDGTWAFQIPMNLDYVITDETGNTIPSADQNEGVPTRADVRFRISMDETGGEGKLRTRAKYLVPNNPQNRNEIDYNFDENTKDSSFKNLYWNKIYTISNFIPRYQKQVRAANNRNMIGMKDVDACVGSRNPFPYNRIDTDINPIFTLLCILISIVGFIIYLINITIIAIINGIISIINGIIDFLNSFGFGINKPDYIPCISVECPADSGVRFAPGCRRGSNGFNQSNLNGSNLTYYCGDDFNGSCSENILVGLDDCWSFQMAVALNIFKFDFYNDWIVGTLYYFLLKYKKRRKGAEKFCEYDCRDFTSDPNYTGADGNKNGIPDNFCWNQELLDTCFKCGDNPVFTQDCQKETRDVKIREGLVKKYEDELYYASTTHSTNFRLFATDIICLGSVLNCDWQGYPKLQDFLVETTYKLPTETGVIEQQPDGSYALVESGMVTINETNGLFFDINCGGLHVNSQQCLNLRHICEFGVDVDTAIFDDQTNIVLKEADGTISVEEISDFNLQFRDTYTYINRNQSFPTRYLLPIGIDTNFNINRRGVYDFSSISDNGRDYANFRGYTSDNYYVQPKHSYFMFFGMVPGKTALSKMNFRYFNPCPIVTSSNISVLTTITPSSVGCNGQIILDFVGGEAPYYYTVTSNNTNINGVPQQPYYHSGNTETLPISPLNGLCSGTYVITGVDSLGYPFSKTVSVSGPQPLECLVSVSSDVASLTTVDGEITIYNIIGGVPPYTYNLYDSNNNPIQTSLANPIQSPATITNLPIGTYKVVISDSENKQCITTGLTINGITTLTVTPTKKDASCPNTPDGEITLTVTGGRSIYFFETTGITDTTFYSNSATMTGLLPGQYSSRVSDSSNPPQIFRVISTISTPQPLQIDPAANTLVYKQCDPNTYKISFIATDAGVVNSLKDIEYRLDADPTWFSIQSNGLYTTPGQIMSFNISAYISNSITFRLVGNGNCRSNSIEYNSIRRPSAALSATHTKIFNNNTGLYTYTVTINGGIGSYNVTSTQQNTVSINNNVATIQSTFNPLTIKITDNVGCEITKILT